VLLCAGCGEKEPVLARVGDGEVTAADLRAEIGSRPPTGDGYLDSLPGRKELVELIVRRRIVLSEANRAAFARRPDVKKKLDDIEAHFEREKRESLDRVVIGEFFRYLQERDLKVADQEVRDFWEKESEARAAHILVSDPAVAADLRARLEKGGDFAALAKQYSEDPATGRQGGDLGYVLKGTLVPEFESALFALKDGEVSGVVSSAYGHHIIKKLSERRLSTSPFEETAERVRSVLEKGKFQGWMTEARRRYRVEVDEAALAALPPAGPDAGTAAEPPRP
jgi:parvulin-like peptidyl-prolyl isomerase